MTAAQSTHELSIPLPHAVGTTVRIHLTVAPKHLLLLLTTRSAETPSGPAPLGSFVYALPSPTGKPLSTPLYVREQTLETATRVAQILAKRTKKPVYVGCSMSFSSAGMGGAVEEEMNGIRKVINTIMAIVDGSEVENGLSGLELTEKVAN